MNYKQLRNNISHLLSPRVIIYTLIMLAFALRLYHLDHQSLRGDEAFSVVFSRQSPRQIIEHLLRSVEPHPPLYNFLLHYWMRGAGTSELSIRYLSLFFSVLTAPLLWRFGCLLGRYPHNARSNTALLAIFLLGVNPFDIFYAQEARMYTLITFLGLVTAYLAFKAHWGGHLEGARHFLKCRAPRDKASYFTARDAVLYALISAAAVYTHYYALFLILFENLFVWGDWANRQIRKYAHLPICRWLAAQILTLILIAPWLILISSTLADYHGIGSSPALWDAFRRVITAFSVQAVPPVVANIAFLITTALILFGMARARERRAEISYLLLYFSIPILAVWVASLQRPIFLERYLAFVLPAFLLLVAYGANGQMRKRGEIEKEKIGCNRARSLSPISISALFLLRICIFAYLLIALFSLNNLYHNPRYAKSGHWREIIGFIVDRSAPGDIVVQNYHDPAPAYYLRDRVPNTVRPVDAAHGRERKERDLRTLLVEYQRIWLIPNRHTWWDEDNFVERWLDRECDVASSEMVYGMLVKLYLTPQAIRARMRRVGARVDDAITLLGYQIHYETVAAGFTPAPTVTPVYHAGETIRLSLYWERAAPVTTDYMVFTHLVDPTGVLRGQRDNPPARGVYPTTSWRAGQMIIDPYEVVIAADAPPGDYVIRVGMYDPQTGRRAPVWANGQRAADDSLVLATVRVEEKYHHPNPKGLQDP